MDAARQYAALLSLNVRMNRSATWFLAMVNVAFAVGLVIGLGYLIPNVSDTTATFLVTGTATQMIVTVALVGLPQYLAQARLDGRLEYFFTLPILREAYLLALVSFVFLQALPALVLALAFGAWHYGFALDIDPAIVLVVPLAVLSLAGFGIAIAVLSPHFQLTNAITQLTIFYVLFFAPVMLPADQLPAGLRGAAYFLPPTYVADAIRASVSDLPDTHLWRSIAAMAGFGVGSLVIASVAVRRRG